MSELRPVLERLRDEFTPLPDAYERLVAMRNRKHRRQRLAAGAMALVVAIAGIGLAAWAFRADEREPRPTAAVTNGAIAFTSGVGGYHVAAVTLDGVVTDLTQPTGGEYDLGPVWSPDGSRIAFLRYTITDPEEGTADYELFVAEADGSGLVNFDQNAVDFSWSPDGTAIAYASFQRGSDYDVFIAGADGSGRRALVDGPLTDVEPSWSPTGDAIAFVSHPVLDRDPGDADVNVVHPDGTSLTKLTGSPEWDYEPVWSPDGTKIAYLSEHVDQREIWVINADGSERVPVTDAPTNDLVSAAWSPDGTRIAFEVYTGTSWDIYLVNADGTGQMALANGPMDETGAEWSPDGSLIAYSAAESSESCRCDNSGSFDVYVVRPDGTDSTRLTTGAQAIGGDLSWQPVLVDSPVPSPTERATLQGEIAATLEVGEDVRSVVYGAGSVWVAVSNNDGTFAGRIIRIDPETNEILGTIPVETIPTWEVGGGAMVAADGSLWVTGGVEGPGGPESAGGGSDAAVVRIDTSTNEVVDRFTLGGTVGADLTFMEGDLWVLVFGDETVDHRMEVVRADPATGDVFARILLTAGWAHRIVAAGGRLLVIEGGPRVVNEGGRMTSIDPATNEVAASAGIPSRYSPHGPVQWRGELWASLEDGFARFDPVTGQLLERSTDLDPSRFAIGLGYIETDDRGIWFLGYDGVHGGGAVRLDRFDPETDAVTELVELDEGCPVAMAVGPDSVWILSCEGTLTRVDLIEG